MNILFGNDWIIRGPQNGLSFLRAGGKVAGYGLDLVNERYFVDRVSKSFSEAVTFARAGNATMVDSDGVLKWAPHNFLTYSEQFDNASWSKTESTVTANTIAAPNGTVTADKIVETTGTNVHTVSRSASAPAQTTISVWMKAAERKWGYIRVDFVQTFFDLSSGTVGTDLVGDATIEDAGNGWFLCSVTTSDTSYILRFGPTTGNGTVSYTGDGTSGIYLWGAHLYRSDLGGMVDNPDRGDSYVPTTSAARYLPRLGHHVWDGSQWVNKGLLLESEQRTNLITYSEDFTDVSWLKERTTVDANLIAAPDGTTTADKLEETNVTNSFRVRKNVDVLEAAYTLSFYVKAAERDKCRLFAGNVNANADFDLSLGEVTNTSSCTASIAYAGDGWWRVAIQYTQPSAQAGELHLISTLSDAGSFSYTGTDGEGIYVWGAQLEAAPTPSSYIPTSVSQATRAAETLTASSDDLPWSSDAVSIQMEGEMTYADGDDTAEVIHLRWEEDADNRVEWNSDTRATRTGQVEFIQEATGTTDVVASALDSYAPGINVPFNLAARHGSTFINGAVDGSALTEDTTPTALPDLSSTDLNIGYNFMGTISEFRVWADDIGDAGIEEASS